MKIEGYNVIFQELLRKKGINTFEVIDSFDDGKPDKNGVEPQSGIIVADDGVAYNFNFNFKDNGEYYFRKFEKKEIKKVDMFYKDYQKALEILKQNKKLAN